MNGLIKNDEWLDKIRKTLKGKQDKNRTMPPKWFKNFSFSSGRVLEEQLPYEKLLEEMGTNEELKPFKKEKIERWLGKFINRLEEVEPIVECWNVGRIIKWWNERSMQLKPQHINTNELVSYCLADIVAVVARASEICTSE